jgi:broad specificity phosphatase PhoE
MEIYLIRHGECFNSSQEHYSSEKQTMDPPLTPIGVEQAKKLGHKIKDKKFDRIYSSDLIRAIETSRIINESIRSETIITKNFREIDMGSLLFKTWNDYPEIYNKWKIHEEDISYPDGENGNDVWKRCKQELTDINLSNFNRIAIICHGGTIRSIICGLLNIPQQKRFYFGSPPMNCSINIITLEENQFYLHVLNDYTHLI